jgi:2-keto-4-pentenoate hydratase/2-oxohepta-3-ene-1,7-dioic acid hydratase in catechol pathway
VDRPGPEQAIRVWTEGRPPVADDPVEFIDDPFDAVHPRRGGTPTEHATQVARALPARTDGPPARVGDLALEPPVWPHKIVCVGRNYRAHAAELGNEVPDEPVLFHKPPSSLVPSGAAIVLPPGFERIDMEAELVAVVGATARALDHATALQCIAGYCVGNDVSNRDLQRRDDQWTRAKGFDTFAAISSFVRIVDPGESPPGSARVQGRLGGELRQDAALQDMVFDIPTVLAYVSETMTLEPGDLIYTGTPQGVSPLHPGDVTEVALHGWAVAELRNPVVAAPG